MKSNLSVNLYQKKFMNLIELINKVKNNTKEIFEKNKSEDISNETSTEEK